MHHALDLAMVLLHLHSQNSTTFVQVLHVKADEDAEFAHLHATLSQLEMLLSQFALASFAQITPVSRRLLQIDTSCHGFQRHASNTAPRRGFRGAKAAAILAARRPLGV